ncbi:putative WD repeat-containing protein alr3466 OS=Nostoc sp, (strain PCC 7120 / UTEX 2576) GN=alr3466 PE=4 SV=1 [Rhizoctonia solani AG-1 IB]|uniref:Putative WD repeat-containing protein alr3466 n=1 Tax=Thanatephorus cucumeris (strain AG1-IB / isolate 7/3/14) TaxID=1108050 RepID=A0A0B7FZQ5_THACB|nr:putative WD repeat-containing protein alr3466 OS=Nostoc sp, (strain PCC 7120 / UTEX 2576) GN=alr3466 PE=4 SV=1 [Rhizoctonia solani AG-1 IB]
MQLEQPRGNVKPWSDRILGLFWCLGRRTKPGAENHHENHGDTMAVQLANIKECTSAENEYSSHWNLVTDMLAGLESAVTVFPPLKDALSGLREAIQRTEISKQNSEAYKQLALELKAQISALQGHVDQAKPSWMAHSIAKIAYSLKEENQFIQAQRGRSDMSRIRNAISDENEIIQSYRRVESLFRQLQTDISFSTWYALEEQQMNSRLEKLSPVFSAQYDSAFSTEAYRGGCTPGTRKKIIQDFKEWVCTTDTFNVYWMNGMPGTGKTTIAFTLCDEFETAKQLGACFFCSHISPDCRTVSRIFPTIAYQLAEYSNPYRNKILEVLANMPNIAQRSVAVQFKNLILEPLQSSSVKVTLPTDVVVIIDALDECSSGGAQILSLLVENAAQLPIKFIVTSRPDPLIARQMEVLPTSSAHKAFYLHDIGKSLVQEDIKAYLMHEFHKSKFAAASEDIERLAAYAGNLFIVAATTVRYILGHGTVVTPSLSRERMRTTLEMARTGLGTDMQHIAIDSLYKGILSHILKQLEEGEKAKIHRVLWATLCIREPVSINTLSKILTMEPEIVHDIIRLLQSVLHLSEETEMVTTLHGSFPDFMFNPERASDLYCDRKIQEDRLVRSCFSLMENQLRFNICNLKTSYYLDEDYPDLNSQMDAYISPELFYACRYWVDHLRGTSASTELSGLLKRFLYEHLLFWIEVINLRDWVSNATNTMSHAFEWLTKHNTTDVDDDAETTHLRSAIRDAQNFITSFSASPVSHSTPHLYLSLLPTSSKHSDLFIHHRKKFHGLPGTLIGPALGSRGGAGALAVWTIGSQPIATAVSPDGTRLALSTYGGGLNIWDIRLGEIVLDLVADHTEQGDVCSVVFSHHGNRLASGSKNGTICIWDVANAGLLIARINGHANRINKVVFSPNSSMLASASADGSVCLWNLRDEKEPILQHRSWDNDFWDVSFSPDGLLASAGSGQVINLRNAETGSLLIDHNPLEGHAGAVDCILFSQDGSRLVSFSTDMTVRVWKPHSGTLLAGPFRTPILIDTILYQPIALSPDPEGSLLAYAADDATIRVINTMTGEVVSGPFTGHTSAIKSVHFLSNGTQLLSSSVDGTIRIWDTHYDVVEPVAAYEGHTMFINSVAFSTDGAQVVSGSDDRAICLWNATSGALIRKISSAHEHDIIAVTFSPDGTKIASGSRDNSVRIWDPQNGTLTREPLTGHTSWVRAVKFSPDGNQLVSGADDWVIRVWDLRHDEVSSSCLEDHSHSVRSVEYSADGTRIVSGSDDHNIGLWDAQKLTLIWMGARHTSRVYSVIFSPDGNFIASGSDDRTIVLWRAHSCTAEVIGEPLVGHTQDISSLAFSPDGKNLASGSPDHTILVWDVDVRKLRSDSFKFEGYSGVSSVAFSPDGRHIVSGSQDASIRRWDVSIGENSTNSEEALWVARKDGWVIDQDSRLLVWLPHDMRGRIFLDPRNDLTILAGEAITPQTPNIDDFLVGDRWQNCYRGTAL